MNTARKVIFWISKLHIPVTTLSAIILIFFNALGQYTSIKLWGHRPNEDILFWGVIIAYIITSIMSFVRNKANEYKISDIKSSSNDEIKYFKGLLYQERIDSLKDHLREIAESLEFTMQERICVYRFIEEEKLFECVGRYSLHHQYGQLSDRKKYPSDAGIIAHVWKNGELNGSKRDDKIPDYQNKKNYFEYLKDEYKIEKKVAKNFRMNPVDIYAEVIRDTKKFQIAVIIFESQRKNFLDEGKLKEKYNDIKREAIITSLDKLKDQNPPNLKTASEAQL